MSDNIYFPFGYGLSYGRADYSNLQVKADSKHALVTVKLSNPSTWDIAETVQVYVSAPGAGTTAPFQQLAAFKRVQLTAGASTEVLLEVPVDRMMTVQEDGSRKLLKGEYTITVSSAAPSSRNAELGVSALTAKIKL